MIDEIDYASICSGIEAASLAWECLDFKPRWFAEIEPFPSAVLAYRWPKVPNLGDMTKLAREVLLGIVAAPLILVGGTPCQDFSVAGMRAGLAGERGALTIKFVELADAIDHVRPAGDECVVVWENVPGVLSDKGNAFGCFLGALVGESDALMPAGPRWSNAGCVYGPKRTAAWRVLDAQYFGVAQRRRRVFVAASARADFDPAAVLFESEGVRRDRPPRRGSGQDLAGHAPFGPALQCGCGYTYCLNLGEYGCPNCEGDEGPAVEVMAGVPAFGGENQSGSLFQAGALTAHGLRNDFASETFCVEPVGTLRATDGGSDVDHAMAGHLVDVAGTLQAGGKAAGSATLQDAEQGLLIAFSCKDYGADAGELAPTLRAMGHGSSHANAGGQVAVCITGEVTHTLKAKGFDGSEDGTGRGQPIVFDPTQITSAANRSNPQPGDPCHTLAKAQHPPTLAGSLVRRLTPRECERLQGMPDDHTLIPWTAYQRAMRAAEAALPRSASADEVLRARIAALYSCDVSHEPVEDCPDGPRYKAIGNSKAVPVVRWLGRRIKQQLERRT